MKRILIGILLGVIIYPAIADITELIDDKYETNMWVKVGVPSYGLTLGLTGRCNDTMRPSGVTNGEYFGCGKINKAINKVFYGKVK